MMTFFKALFGGISLVIIYMIIVMAAPIVLFLLGYSDINSKPAIFNFPLYIIEINGDTFYSKATNLGLFLSLLLGTSLYYLIPLLIPKKWKRRSK
ncbi:hypothetical protein ACFSKI_21900 [Pseudogracilibacillus auburnensis]|uniref:Uncharacterized protein n=1 Tax=Pseudogracilibacillus auburnensis TaxID=1494959 RepID=A0A2V3VWM4_9BACI|nr:hypothetical protein [Pseudogracilibacillus auburnensis]MBO1004546.1 hypothetical protein [Pseudogracilibacillus auburnensis]PXW85251.1 hypothetical protein DFR56_11117 [Pseudogracilibacillus auburnensis]